MNLPEPTAERRKVATTAELIRKGATLLNETCPRCGGVQIRYQGKIYCINEDNLSNILSAPSAPARSSVPVVEPAISKRELNAVASKPATASAASERDALRSLLEEKLAKVSRELESSQDFDQQAKLLDLISKYLETLEKLKANAISHNEKGTRVGI